MAAFQILSFPVSVGREVAPVDAEGDRAKRVRNYINPNVAGLIARPVVTARIVDSPLAALGQDLQVELPLHVLAVKRELESLSISDGNEVRPTDYAFQRATGTVLAAYVSDKQFHAPRRLAMGTDDSGGILMSWRVGDKYVAANFGARPQSRSFIYFEQGADRGSVELTEQHLSEKLRWLSQR